MDIILAANTNFSIIFQFHVLQENYIAGFYDIHYTHDQEK